MYVHVQHQVHVRDLFKEKVNGMAPPPDTLARHQFFIATDLAAAACLWEAPSIDDLRDYIDPSLEPASTQTFFQVYEERAVGLPESQLVPGSSVS